MSEKKTVYDYTGAQFLDPQSCGSSVRCSAHVWIENGKLYISSFAELKDCSHLVEWSGRGAKGTLDMEKKLTVAIRELTALRGAVRDAGRAYLAKKKERAGKRRVQR